VKSAQVPRSLCFQVFDDECIQLAISTMGCTSPTSSFNYSRIPRVIAPCSTTAKQTQARRKAHTRMLPSAVKHTSEKVRLLSSLMPPAVAVCLSSPFDTSRAGCGCPGTSDESTKRCFMLESLGNLLSLATTLESRSIHPMFCRIVRCLRYLLVVKQDVGRCGDLTHFDDNTRLSKSLIYCHTLLIFDLFDLFERFDIPSPKE
jgi:hypothetical protein